MGKSETSVEVLSVENTSTPPRCSLTQHNKAPGQLSRLAPAGLTQWPPASRVNTMRRSRSWARSLDPCAIFVSSRRSRSACLTNFNCVFASIDRLPCRQALRFPLGAPQLLPPCILHRCLPLTAGDLHGAPDLVRAPQRGAFARFSGCMGLFVEWLNFLVPVLIQRHFGRGRVNLRHNSLQSIKII